MNYGHLELRIEELLKERDISKNTICKVTSIDRIVAFLGVFTDDIPSLRIFV